MTNDFQALAYGAAKDAAVERCMALLLTAEPNNQKGHVAFVMRTGGIKPFSAYQIEIKARVSAIQQVRDAMTPEQLEAERVENRLAGYRRLGAHAKHRAGMTTQEKEDFGEMK